MDVSVEVDQIGIHNLGINENNPDENVDEKVSGSVNENQIVPEAKNPRRSGRFRLRTQTFHSQITHNLSMKSRVIMRPKKLNVNIFLVLLS